MFWFDSFLEVLVATNIEELTRRRAESKSDSDKNARRA